MTIQKQDLDVEEALQRFNGNQAIFSKLLKRFIEINSNIEEKTTQLVNSGNSEEIFIFFHSLKGGAGNLSAKNLYKKSTVLEDFARNGDFESIKKELPSFYDVYDQLKIAVADLEKSNS
ncbi:Hpt domain-containing protein [Desulfomicrobium baculatum]|uniref:Hpt domain-containing protein n=1 Tax=Desulfomicrobium baculatum TaxID=899 RepID=UPI00019E26A5|nr:Hpt domain-containing protein [Desulfomicrobium baculatum]